MHSERSVAKRCTFGSVALPASFAVFWAVWWLNQASRTLDVCLLRLVMEADSASNEYAELKD